MKRVPFAVMCVALLFAAGPLVASETLVLVQTIPLQGVPGKLDHLTVDREGMRLFVANKPNNTLDVVDLKNGQLVKQIPDQALAVIEKVGDKYEVVSKIPTPRDSRTCVWSGGKLYLGVPKQETTSGPEVQIYEARPIVEAEATKTK